MQIQEDFIQFYENLCFQLRNTYKGKNTWEIENSEKILKSLSEQYESFLEVMFIIITNEKHEG